jgi:hypothetical protein
MPSIQQVQYCESKLEAELFFIYPKHYPINDRINERKRQSSEHHSTFFKNSCKFHMFLQFLSIFLKDFDLLRCGLLLFRSTNFLDPKPNKNRANRYEEARYIHTHFPMKLISENKLIRNEVTNNISNVRITSPKP